MLAKSGDKNSSTSGKSGRDPFKTVEGVARRKSSFLDQLAEKLAGNETKNLLEENKAVPIRMVNANTTSTTSWSSRCQHCRQRCKTRVDLLSHLKNCPQALAAQISVPVNLHDEQVQSTTSAAITTTTTTTTTTVNSIRLILKNPYIDLIIDC